MKYEYIYYLEDRSFDYGDFTHYDIVKHGFSIEINNNTVNCNTIEGFGNYEYLTQLNFPEGLEMILRNTIDEVEISKQIPQFKHLIGLLQKQIGIAA